MSQSLERGLTVLTQLAAGPHTLDELAGELGVHKSTAMRLLRTLEGNRFVRREGPHHYRLGSALFDLANRALEDLDVRSAARPHLVALGEATGHTIHLAMFEDDQVVYVDKVDSRHPVRMYSRVGRLAPLHCTAVGKALVAEWSPRRREDLARRLVYPPLTGKTPTSPEEFLTELDQVRDQGYALDRGEHEDFIHCIGAPIRDSRGDVAVSAEGAAQLRRAPRARRQPGACDRRSLRRARLATRAPGIPLKPEGTPVPRTGTVVSTNNAPAPPAAIPLSQGVRKGNLLQVSGQTAVHLETGALVEGGLSEQTEQVLRNVIAILEAGGAGLEDVLMLRVYLTDIAHFAELTSSPA